MRLRRGQRWLYLVLAVVFAATFAGVGVGSGSGAGLDQLYSGLFGSGSNAVSKAKGEIEKNPAKGYRDLATAYEAKGDSAAAMSALRSYLEHNKMEIGGLEMSQGRTYAAQYQAAQQAAQQAAPGQAFQPSGPLGQALGSNPVEQTGSQQASGRTTQLYQQATGAYSAAMQDFQQVEKLQPRNSAAVFQVATAAQNAGQYPVTLKALKRYLKLSPHSPQKGTIEHAIKQLEKALNPPQPKSK
jgi:tetratricopeptide (TPR) repeat protein